MVTEFPTDGALLRFDGAGAAGAGFFCGAAFAGAGFFCGAAFTGAGCFFDADLTGTTFPGGAAFFGAGFFGDAALAALAGAFFDAAATVGFLTAFAAALGFAAGLRVAPAAEREGALPDFARLPATGLLFAIPNPIL